MLELTIDVRVCCHESRVLAHLLKLLRPSVLAHGDLLPPERADGASRRCCQLVQPRPSPTGRAAPLRTATHLPIALPHLGLNDGIIGVPFLLVQIIVQVRTLLLPASLGLGTSRRC